MKHVRHTPFLAVTFSVLLLAACAPSAEAPASEQASAPAPAAAPAPQPAPVASGPALASFDGAEGLITSEGIDGVIAIGQSLAEVEAMGPAAVSPTPSGFDFVTFGGDAEGAFLLLVCKSSEDVGAISVLSSAGNANIKTEEGLSLSSSEDDVIAALGEPTELVEDAETNTKVLRYQTAPDRMIEFEFRDGASIRITVHRVPICVSG